MKNLLFIIQIIIPSLIFSQTDLIVNSSNRMSRSLNGMWSYIVDPYENGYYNYRYQAFDQFENPGTGAYFTNSKPKNKSELIEYDFDLSDSIKVPGDWNSQKENLFYYEGTVWYKKSFDYAKASESNRQFLYFGAVNYQADVYLNGEKLGEHIGGFTPFNFEITDIIKSDSNFLIVKVDNKRKKEGVPTLNTDWWNYGGITRDVKIIETPGNIIADYFIQLDPENINYIKGFIKLKGSEIINKNIIINIPELDFLEVLSTDDSGTAEFRYRADGLTYWSNQNPKLYEVFLKTDHDTLTDQIGFRSIRTEGSSILLNDQKIFLKGISIHEENPLKGGRANTMDDAKILLGWAKELGCNFVRLAHYPHNEYMVRLADQMGILVWDEIPVYWTIDWTSQDTYLNAANQLSEVINRDKNRASVIIWSMSNETPNSSARFKFLQRLAEHTRNMDNTRLISAALEQSSVDGNNLIRTIEDPFAEIADVLSFNQYIGWYDGLPDKCEKIEWKIDLDKPVIISEFGAGAKFGFHGDKFTRWTEEYQEYLYKETVKMLSRIDQLSGMSPWILADFRSPRRPLPKIQDGWNRKGLIDDKGNKKKAFYILQEFYDQK